VSSPGWTNCRAHGGYYAIFTWLPTVLRTERQLSVVGKGGYTAAVIIGSFLGYIVSGYVNDWLGRRGTFVVYSICSAILIVLYTRIPTGPTRSCWSSAYHWDSSLLESSVDT
jgi:predicted MFS family arabinose efflux permease